MALFEIEDQYIEQLRAAGLPVSDRSADWKRARDFQTFTEAAFNNPKYRPHLMSALSESGTYVPEIEAARPLKADIEAIGKKFDDYIESERKRREEEESKRSEDHVNRLLADGRSFLRSQGWDDKGIEEVESFMKDNSVGSYKVASDYMKSKQPNPQPLPTSTWNGGRDLGAAWFAPDDNAPDAPDHKLLLKDPKAFTRNEIAKFFDEKRRGVLNLNA